ncbi:Uracyl-DNA glycosylase, UNG [Carpediemonas membranifera]|uniref:Uracyl-DNA glycosylase, UNG n=1 Tax=Carpediemonas membranifera TaxID=201153 RepID=A0A8J6AZ68_9EUKA|nr:Uracyl-DNA glycosylase, UNG [Carpediemonas membranifera]|eukprot:KAG9389537.1 Uracyl-DNA glycosylase, UNG [Carpediemonas membranifera]
MRQNNFISEAWSPLREIVAKQPNVDEFIDAPGVIPAGPLVFRALNEMAPKDVKIVIFGQDPYPRKESAIGQAFNDGKVKKWTDPMSPSLRNIIKSILISQGLADSSTKVPELRAALAKSSMAQPPAWFSETARRGVLWLNTALTFSGGDDLAKHTKFWKPVVTDIIRMVLEARKEEGVVFVMFGKPAQKLQTTVEVVNATIKARVGFVPAPHPAREGFHADDKTPFTLIAEKENELGFKPVSFMVSQKRKAAGTLAGFVATQAVEG